MSERMNPEFLKGKYNLQNSEEVASAAKRTEVRTGEAVPEKPLARIQNYLDRFTEIIKREKPEDREHGIDALKRLLHHKFVIKPQDVPESTYLLEQRIARELGHGDIEITDKFKDRKTTEIVENQTSSLDKWVDYLASDDADYPDWAKYWAFRSMLEMGKLEKKAEENAATGAVVETAVFRKRTKDTVVAFPPMNPRALAMTIGVLESRLTEKVKPKAERQPVQNASIKLDDPTFQALLSTENFSKIYTQFLIELPEYSTEGLQDTRGRWVLYPKGSSAQPLVDSLEGHPLEWCTANLTTAQNQLEGGDFHVYYSFDQDQQPNVPRVAIRMENDRIAEVRGIAPDQNTDPYIAPVVEEKMKEFPDGESYQKKARDMRRLTAVEKKVQSGRQLDKKDLRFLYEIDSPIEFFGYQQVSRVKKLLAERKPDKDILVVFECNESQIARSVDQITEDTQAYVGPLEPGIFQRLPERLEHIYTSFPDGHIRREQIEIGGSTTKELEDLLEKKGMQIVSHARSMMHSAEFTTTPNPEEVKLIRLRVVDMGFPNTVTTQEIFNRAISLGLELCPPEVGPQYRLHYTNQPMHEWVYVGMKTISDSDGDPSVFNVGRDDDGTWLDNYWAGPDDRGFSYGLFVFRLRKSDS